MQSEQQQRIMGYFIEEAKDHLNTIEQGLLSLQSTMEDTEMVNEIFRAAHSIKGGAAMLGLNSIQQTAHRLEDCFKVLKESPVKVDHYLESLFLQVFDTLQALIDQLQRAFGLTDEAAKYIMLDAEPVFEKLNRHLGELVKQAGSSSVATVEATKVPLTTVQLDTIEDKKMLPVTFKRTVLVELREMLQLFKQQDSPEHRQVLQEHCERLRQLGEQLDLPGWGELLETARAAIAFEPNSYRQLASLTIKEIKQAQELLIAGRSVEIAPSEKLKALVPTLPGIESVIAFDTQEQDIALTSDTNFTTESSFTETARDNSNATLISSATDWFNSPDGDVQEDIREELNEHDFTQDPWRIEDLGLATEQDSVPDDPAWQFTQAPQRPTQDPMAAPQFPSDAFDFQFSSTNAVSQPGESSEPEVGIAELNSLADIFEGQTPDLDQTWQQEEIISLDDSSSATDSGNIFSLDDPSDFSDLDLIDEADDAIDSFEIPTPDQSSSNDLMGWLDDDSTEEVAHPSQESIDELFSDFDFETTSSTTDNADFSSVSVSEARQIPSEGASAQETSTLTSSQTSDFSDLLFETDNPDLPVREATHTDDLNSLFGDSFFEENSSLEENAADFVLDADAMPELQRPDNDLFVLPEADELNDADTDNLFVEEARSSSLSTSPDKSQQSVISEDYLSERLTENENDSLTFEDPFILKLEDLGGDEIQWDEAPLAESELEIGDLLELANSLSSAYTSPHPSENGNDSSEPEAMFFDDADAPEADNAVRSRSPRATSGASALESLHSSTPQDDVAFIEELVMDNEATDFGGDELTFDEYSPDLDFAVGEDEPWSESQSEHEANTLNASSEPDDLLFNWDEPELALEDMGSPALDAYDLDLDLDATSTSLSSLDENSSGEIDDLFENDLFSDIPNVTIDSSVPNKPASELPLPVTPQTLPRSADAPEVANAELALTENASSSGATSPTRSGEEPDRSSFDSSEGLNNLFSSQTADAEAPSVEQLNLGALEELEAIPDFDTLNDFFDFDTDSEATDPSDVDSTLIFEDLSSFEMPATTDNFEAKAVGSLPESDFASLWSDENPVEMDALDLSEGEPYTLDFEEDLLATSNTSSPEWNFETQEEPTGAEQAAIFDFDGEDAWLTNPQASDLAALQSNESPLETDALEVSQENLFETAQDSDRKLDSVGETADSWLNWGENASEARENLEDFLGASPEAVTDAHNLDEVLNAAQGLDIPNVDTNALSEDWNFEPEVDEIDETVAAARVGEVVEGSAPAAAEDDFSFFTVEENDQTLATTEWDSLDELEDLGSTWPEATTHETSELSSFEGDIASVQPLEDESGVSDSDAKGSFLASAEAGQGGAQALQSPDGESLEALDSVSVAPEELVGGTLGAGASELWELSPQRPEFDELETLGPEAISADAEEFEVFEDLEAFLGEQTPAADQSLAPVNSEALEAETFKNDEFGDLETLLEQAEKTMGGTPAASADQRQPRPQSRQRPRIFEQTMRVPVKHLDSLSNLVGELVVNRNSLEQDQEQLRQFLDNLSNQVLALSDVGARMQDLYERSLLESSLLASRHTHRSVLTSDSLEDDISSGVEYDPLEMDRFTGFHLLSQEMIELIVRVRESASDIELLVDGTDHVARMLRQVTTQLQEGLTRSRMVPFAQTADRLPRAVREISIKLRKQAELHVEGRETLIDKMILEHLYDPLTHLVNNAITHGIESPEVRKAAGKPPIGRITLRAFHQGNQTVISISDDGAGIDPEGVRQKAIEKRLITSADAQNLTNLDLYDFLFRPGFTTKDKADDFSGRGVGMDVVRTSLSEIRGVVQIDSTLGAGTTFTLRLPLTLSICKALCCLSDRARIAFPMDGVEDMLDLPSDRVVTNSEGQTCIQWREMLLAFQPLSDLLTYKRQLSRNTVYGGKREDDIISIVVLRSAGNFLAILVDQVLGEQEIVIKQLEGPPPKPVGIAGATVLGDGRIMPIADVLELIDLAQGRIRKDSVTIWSRDEPHDQVPAEIPASKPEPMVLIVDDSITVRELLSMTFTKAGYRVEQARDGQEAWDKLRSGLPCDIVFCDIEMPRMDGLELLSRLQKDDILCRLPIAMLTSRGADRHRQMASQLGASGYFTKPYLEEVLLDAAQRMIKGEVLFSSSGNA